jgi:hypothetical protein
MFVTNFFILASLYQQSFFYITAEQIRFAECSISKSKQFKRGNSSFDQFDG